MKKASLFVSAIALSFFMASCGGASTEKAQDEANKENKEMADEAKKEEAGMTGKMMIDTASSMVHWKGTMVGVYSHEGNIMLKNGYLTMENGQITGGEFEVDMTTIQPTDENYNPEEGSTPEKLVQHLTTDEFFAINDFPTAKFVVKSADLEAGTITGDLTIRGNTHEAVVENVEITDSSAMGKLVFDRQKYDVSWKAMKDKVLADDIELDIELKMMPEEA